MRAASPFATHHSPTMTGVKRAARRMRRAPHAANSRYQRISHASGSMAEQHLGPFRHDEIRVRVDDDAAHALTYEPAAPAVQAESVMEHDDRPVAQHRAQPSVCHR